MKYPRKPEAAGAGDSRAQERIPIIDLGIEYTD
jgi:hypothetical protein